MQPPDALLLPPAHPQRLALNDEAHARPSAPLSAPLDISYIALLGEQDARDGVLAAIRDLARSSGAPPPEEGADHYAGDFGRFHLRWERHTEFSRLAVSVRARPEAPAFERHAATALPPGWLPALPGQLLVAVHLALRRAGEAADGGAGAGVAETVLAARHFPGSEAIGGHVLEGRGAAFTDFRIGPDGFSRVLLLDHAMTAAQAGRTAQRLLEIETYRLLALLAFPLARNLAPFLHARERELAGIAAILGHARPQDEAALLGRLTALAAAIEAEEAAHLHRFSASAAYYDLIRRRIAELRERRIEGFATFDEFVERRLAPAMATCASVTARHEALSRRVARATQLLSTRVELTREEQSLAVLASMDRRARMQLRLQQTVEGLSVAAITYYVVGLIGQVANGLGPARLGLSPAAVTAAAVPVVALLVAWGLHRSRRHITLGRGRADA
ncbi:DUF3422 family protein [Muricoccus vinaceus]|uniref:DUF3422 family protein n=1 Tax=Muricoccus vinaceus TaxID=424704 RepID=A0ABV6J0P9_9PROT